MILKYYRKGNCHAVFSENKNQFVYKVSLSRNFDNNPISISLNPKYIYKCLLEESRYRKNLIRFNNSIKILNRLEKLSEKNLDKFFPNSTIILANKFQLIIDSKTYYYSGQIIKQEFVNQFFDNTTILKNFDWAQMLNVQLELWKYGVGIGAPAETWGPKNWGKTNSNAIKLVDTSHLTDNFNLVSEMIDTDIMEYRKRKLLSMNTKNNLNDIEEYFKFMKSSLNLKNLNRQWGIYLN